MNTPAPSEFKEQLHKLRLWLQESLQTLQPVFALSETKILVILALAIGVITGVGIYVMGGLLDWIFDGLGGNALEPSEDGGFFLAATDAEGRRFGDKFAQTRVIEVDS